MAERHPMQEAVQPSDVPRKYRKRCTRCKKWFRINQKSSRFEGIGRLGSSASDGYQNICKHCKSTRQTVIRNMDPVKRMKHHFSTRITRQLGPYAHRNVTTKLEQYLGYPLKRLHKKLSVQSKEDYGLSLKRALIAGYHIDHIRPLSSFSIFKPGALENTQDWSIEDAVDWDVFRACWHPDNLKIVTAGENLRKGAKWETETA